MEGQNPNQKGLDGSRFGEPKKSPANSPAPKKGLLRKGRRSPSSESRTTVSGYEGGV
jgi:hypothetical protein